MLKSLNGSQIGIIMNIDPAAAVGE